MKSPSNALILTTTLMGDMLVPLKIRLLRSSQSFQQINLGRVNQAMAKGSFAWCLTGEERDHWQNREETSSKWMGVFQGEVAKFQTSAANGQDINR